YAEEGDFSAAGAVNVNYLNFLEKPLVEVEGGTEGFRRALLAGSTRVGEGQLLAAVELYKNDGPWTHPDDYRKVNGVLRWSQGNHETGFSLTGVFYQGKWNSTDQIAQRGVDLGLYGRFDTIDPSDGGKSHRYSLAADWQKTSEGSQTKVQAYAIDYALNLWSNFTYYLDDPVNGDQFEQADRRGVLGLKASQRWMTSVFGHDVESTVGLQVRNDNIPVVGLYDTKA